MSRFGLKEYREDRTEKMDGRKGMDAGVCRQA